MRSTDRDGRIDGLRGLCGIAVVVSHYLGEVSSGSEAFAVGWIAVNIFFVMSGFLIGRLVLDRAGSSNFFRVFYARRLLRTFPSYAVVVAATLALTTLPVGWRPDFSEIPALSYLTFTQNLFMASRGTTGTEWLAPTWTLAVEEQFYLLAPVAILLLPRTPLLFLIAMACLLALGIRVAEVAAGSGGVASLVSLAGRADALGIGVAAAVVRRASIDWSRHDKKLEIIPLAAIALIAIAVPVLGRDVGARVTSHTLVSIAAAAFLLRLTINAEASDWLQAGFLRTAGHQSYSLYLVHMPVALILHGAALRAHPDIGSPPAMAVTVASAVVTVMIARGLTRFVEDPATRLGRRMRWETSSTPTLVKPA